jgi:hypothetical protein
LLSRDKHLIRNYNETGDYRINMSVAIDAPITIPQHGAGKYPELGAAFKPA